MAVMHIIAINATGNIGGILRIPHNTGITTITNNSILWLNIQDMIKNHNTISESCQMIKKIMLYICVLSLVLLNPISSGMAENLVHKVDGSTRYITSVLNLSDNATAVDLPENLCGGWLYQVEIKTSADDAVTFTINSRLGTQLYTTTTSAATSGQVEVLTDIYILNANTMVSANDYPTYTLSGLGSGTATIEITVIK